MDMKIKMVLVMLLSVFNIYAKTEIASANEPSFSFQAVWKLIRNHAPEIQAINHELESSRILERRLSRHWYPRFFAEGRAYSTNDPTQNLMSLLGQREITQSDFIPHSLNQPGSRIFEKGTVGFDFPLFEGGAKVATADASIKMTAAKSLELRATEINYYAELARTFAFLLGLNHQKQDFEKLYLQIKDLLANYKIGAAANPVGHSGLLGLKNLRNRLEGLLVENTAKINGYKTKISIMAVELPADWMPQNESVRKFVSTYLQAKNSLVAATGNAPAAVQAMQLTAQSIASAKITEKARFMPKIGLFGTGDLYGGNRGSATSYTSGVYLKWDLFDAPNIGATAQAEATAAAASARAQMMNQRAQIIKLNSEQSLLALDKNLTLLEDSSHLLEEQTRTAKNLFQNGAINALQLVEVLARRVDLLVMRTEVENGFAENHAALLVNTDSQGVSLEN